MLIPTIKHVAYDFPEFDGHAEVVRIENKDLGISGFVAIHRKKESFPSLGATRMWQYGDEEDGLRDALRLSRLMSYKSAFADLPYGGAKAVLVSREDVLPSREELFSWYAEEINALGGAFVTGSDVGVMPSDVETMRRVSSHIIGDNVPAGYYTALGVFYGIEAALETLYSTPSVEGRTFAIQGLGKTGMELAKILHEKGGLITASDINPEKTTQALRELPGIVIVGRDDIYDKEVDVFSPCALHHSVNAATLPLLRAKAIVGSANNQMESSDIEHAMHRRGMLYGVDYIVNNGGLISVVDQYQHGTHDNNRIVEKLRAVKEKLMSVFGISRKENRSTASVASELAEEAVGV